MHVFNSGVIEVFLKCICELHGSVLHDFGFRRVRRSNDMHTCLIKIHHDTEEGTCSEVNVRKKRNVAAREEM